MLLIWLQTTKEWKSAYYLKMQALFQNVQVVLSNGWCAYPFKQNTAKAFAGDGRALSVARKVSSVG